MRKSRPFTLNYNIPRQIYLVFSRCQTQDLVGSMCSSNHNEGLGISCGDFRMHTAINDKKILGSPDSCIRSNDTLTIVLGSHVSRAKVMVAAVGNLHDGVCSNITRHAQVAVGLARVAQKFIDKSLESIAVTLGVEERLLSNVGVAFGCDLEGAVRCKTMGEVNLGGNRVVLGSVDCALNVTSDAITAFNALPEVKTLVGLREKTASFSEQLDCLVVGISESGARQSLELVLSFEIHDNDRVVSQTLSNGEIDPLRSRWELNLGRAGLDDANLLLGSDT